MKRFLILLTSMLMIGFFSLFIVAIVDEGMYVSIPDIALSIAFCIFRMFKFPLFYIGDWMEKDLYDGNVFYASYIINIVFWSLFFNYFIF